MEANLSINPKYQSYLDSIISDQQSDDSFDDDIDYNDFRDHIEPISKNYVRESVPISTPNRLTPNRSTPERLTPERSTPERSTPERLTPERLTSERSTPERLTPERLTPERLISERSPLNYSMSNCFIHGNERNSRPNFIDYISQSYPDMTDEVINNIPAESNDNGYNEFKNRSFSRRRRLASRSIPLYSSTRYKFRPRYRAYSNLTPDRLSNFSSNKRVRTDVSVPEPLTTSEDGCYMYKNEACCTTGINYIWNYLCNKIYGTRKSLENY